MNTIQLKDDMKKESKYWAIPMIFFYILTVLVLFAGQYLYYQTKPNWEIWQYSIAYFIIGNFFLYCYLATIKYKIIIVDNTLIIENLFKKTEFNLADTEKYIYKRYRKSTFYRFQIYCKNKKIIFYTRYKDELINILKEYKRQKNI